MLVFTKKSPLECFTTKKSPDISRIFPKFQQNSRTFQDYGSAIAFDLFNAQKILDISQKTVVSFHNYNDFI